MHKVILDTNVFISGILFKGTVRKITESLVAVKFIACISPELKAELRLKLQKKFLLPEQDIKDIELTLDTYCQKYIPTRKVNLCRDPKDNFILELAEESNPDFIVSGDKDLVDL